MKLVLHNPLVGSWNDALTNAAIRPFERLVGGNAVVADDTQVRLARMLVEDLQDNGGRLTPRSVAILGEHVDPAFDLGRLNQAISRMNKAGLGFEDRVMQITTLLGQGPYRPGLSERGDVDLERTLALRREVLAGGRSHAYTHAGELMRQYGIGSPLAAYAASGIALAAAIQAATELQGKERNAPVEGGMGAELESQEVSSIR
jgi:hypothetical protein